MALNGVLSSPLPVQAGVPQGTVLGPVLFLVFINNLSDSLENPLYLFADDSTLCRTIGHPSDRQAASSSLTADLDKITNWSNTWNMSFNPDKSHTLTMSLRKDHLENSPIHFLNNPLEEVLSFNLMGLTICHDLSWESHISNVASKANRRLGILHRAKSLLGPPELLTTYKAFILSLMEYFSPLLVCVLLLRTLLGFML